MRRWASNRGNQKHGGIIMNESTRQKVNVEQSLTGLTALGFMKTFT
jgi:hypothetical protein